MLCASLPGRPRLLCPAPSCDCKMAQKRLETLLGHLKPEQSDALNPASSSGNIEYNVFIVISSYLAAGSDKMRYTTEGSQHILTADQRQFYEDNGFLVIRRLVSQDKLDTFYERFKQVCKKEVKVSTCRYITIVNMLQSLAVMLQNVMLLMQLCCKSASIYCGFTSEAASQTLWASETTKFKMTILGTHFMYPLICMMGKSAFMQLGYRQRGYCILGNFCITLFSQIS